MYNNTNSKNSNINLNIYDYLLIVIIYIFAVYIRTYFINFSDPNYTLITADGFTFAEATRDIIAGFHQLYDQSKIDQPLAIFTATLYKILHIHNLEKLMFFLSAIISPLVIIPIILLAKELKFNRVTTFYGALFTIIASAYFHRTIAGYYDTDMANLFFPITILYLCIKIFNSNKYYLILIVSTLVLVYNWYYPQSYSINLTTTIIVGYLSFIRNFDKRLFLSLFLSSIHIDLSFKIIGLFLIYSNKFDPRIIFWTIFAAFIYNGGFLPIFEKLDIYLNKNTISVNTTHFHFLNLASTIEESNKTGWDTLVQSTTLSSILLILGIIGFSILLFKHKLLYLSLPMFILGLLSIKLGQRFAIYLIPFIGFGIGYITSIIYKSQSNLYKILAIFIIIFSFSLNLYNDLKYHPYPPISSKDIKLLKKFKHKSKRNDYVIAWWDDGYLLKYYSDIKVISDGSRQGGDNLFLSAKIYTTSTPLLASNLAKLSTYYSDYLYKYNYKLRKNKYDKGHYNQISYMLKDFNFTNPNQLIEYTMHNKLHIKTDFTTYLYLDRRYIDLFGLFKKFGDRDLNSGKEAKTNFFVSKKMRINKQKGYIRLFDIKNYMLKIDMNDFSVKDQFGTKLKIRRYIEIEHDIPKGIVLDPNGTINIILLKDLFTYIILDEPNYNSIYIQMMFFNNYDPNLFEPIISNDEIKIYKVK